MTEPNLGLRPANRNCSRTPARRGRPCALVEELRQAFGELLWDPFVPTRAVLAEALGAGAPIHEYGSRARDVIAVYDALAQRLLTLTDED
jgi:hypothetical protein